MPRSPIERGETTVMYSNLSRPDPVLLSPAWTQPPQYSATLAGQLSGGAGFPQPPDHRATAVFGSPQAIQVAPVFASGRYQSSVEWDDVPSINGYVQALQWEQRDSVPLHFRGYGKREVTLAADSRLTAQDIELAPVQERQLTGRIELPPDYTVASKQLTVVLLEHGYIPIANEYGVAISPVLDYT